MAEIAQTATRTIDRMLVRIEHLDKLLGLAGEVIITSSTLHELQRTLQEVASRNQPISGLTLETVKTSSEASRRISQDLHDLVMAIRLVEIGETFKLFRRPVRDLIRKLGREADFSFAGDDVLIDKALAEHLVDPLLHLLRNAVDHGIEAPLERTRAGKPSMGRIVVSARNKEHHTEITVSDDGRGIDENSVRSRAAQLGLTEVNGGRSLLEIISQTGFSTRDDVTDTSGRGVGLDIVRNSVAQLGGTIQLETLPEQGTTFTLTIPKLRAVNIIDALTVRAGEGLYAFPIESIVSFLGLRPEEVQSALGRERYIKYLGEVVVFQNLLGLISDAPSPEDLNPLPVAIIAGKSGRVALAVSELLGPQKLVNVPLEEKVFQVKGVMGTSVFAGGRVGLTLDPDEVAEMGLGADGSAATGGHPAEMAEGPAVIADAATPESEPTGSAAANAAADPFATKKKSDLDQDDVSDLLDELRRSLSELQDTVLTLERQQGGTDLLHQAFRLLHAAKGNFTMLEQLETAQVAHLLETVLDYLRSERLTLTAECADRLLDGVTFLAKQAEALPQTSLPIPAGLQEALTEHLRRDEASHPIMSDRELVGQTFRLSPTVELQVLSALKRGERTFETFLVFESGRQADFLVAYLILRRIGLHGTMLASLPSVDEIEKGECGTALKILWSTSLAESGMEALRQSMVSMYGVCEWQSTPTTIFRYGATEKAP